VSTDGIRVADIKRNPRTIEHNKPILGRCFKLLEGVQAGFSHTHVHAPRTVKKEDARQCFCEGELNKLLFCFCDCWSLNLKVW
jgi:hypothetical protein